MILVGILWFLTLVVLAGVIHFILRRVLGKRLPRGKVYISFALAAIGAGAYTFYMSEGTEWYARNGVPSLFMAGFIGLVVGVMFADWLDVPARSLHIVQRLIIIAGGAFVGVVGSTFILDYRPNSTNPVVVPIPTGEVADRYEDAVVVMVDGAGGLQFENVTQEWVCAPQDKIQEVWLVCAIGFRDPETYVQVSVPRELIN